ncbi:C2 domain protein [Quillaja saponaria]|uniref:C2 domain protein n=1 Tax=Quillaja saponaria TaxID=32244 RepID=A0AAD7M4W9_QUISA|nr:C2 domain protein [Quillaja saponaria]
MGQTGPTLSFGWTRKANDFTLYIDIVHAGSEEDTKPQIGSARLKFREVLEDVGIGGSTSRTLKLKRPSGRPHGKVEVKVTIRKAGYRAHDSYYAPPFGVPPASIREYSAAPPAGHQYRAYNAEPQPYGQPSYGYSEGKQVYGQEEKKKSKYGGIGTGLAVGAVAGVLGGLAISEGVDYVEDKIADDVAERVEDDLGYDGVDF